MGMTDRSMFSAGLAAKVIGVFADEGATPKDLNVLAEKPWLVRRVVSVIRDESEVKAIDYDIDFDSSPALPNGLMVSGKLPGSVCGKMRFDGSKIKTYLNRIQMSRKISGGVVDGTVHLEEFRKIESKVLLGIQLLHFYLSHPQLIPTNWQGEKIFFWGTIYCDYGRNLYVPYMYYAADEEWKSGFRCLNLNFDNDDFAVVLNTFVI